MDREITQIDVSTAGKRCVLRLKGALGKGQADEPRQASLEASALRTDVHIDWSEAEPFDASILQVLLSLKARVSGLKRSLSVGRPTAGVTGYLRNAGFASMSGGAEDGQ